MTQVRQTTMKANEAHLPGDLTLSVVSLIRQESRAGRLIAEAAIFHRLSEEKDPPLQAEEIGSLLRKMMEQNKDLNELVSEEGSRHYYSAQFMTGAYAGILLKKQGDPLQLIAKIVRQNSSDYTRPVPLDLFTQPPLDLTRQEVLNDLARMEAMEEFRDIAQATTSASSVFLYSTRYLEPAHASMLAEWLDVGQTENP
jgi:hypothetical protein